MTMTYGEFGQHIAELMELPQAPSATESFDDLGFDSIQIFDVLCAVEDAGVDIPDDLFAPTTTFGALFATFQDLTSRGEPAKG